MAKDVRTASQKPQQDENPKYAMRTWLLQLGFIGEEFATARDFLTRNLSGDTAFRQSRCLKDAAQRPTLLTATAVLRW